MKTQNMDGLAELHKVLVQGLTDAIKSGEAPAGFYKTAADLLRQEGVLAALLDSDQRANLNDVIGEADRRTGGNIIDEDGNIIDIKTGKVVNE